jgi:hypothetical protein
LDVDFDDGEMGPPQADEFPVLRYVCWKHVCVSLACMSVWVKLGRYTCRSVCVRLCMRAEYVYMQLCMHAASRGLSHAQRSL